MDYSKNKNINQSIYEFLTTGGEEINEAFHEKDRAVVKELSAMVQHHGQMVQRHMNAMGTGGKDKEMNNHDLAIMAHQFAGNHYNSIMKYNNSYTSRQPIDDYHKDKEFYDKLGGLISKRANDKSKECGVSCDTESK